MLRALREPARPNRLEELQVILDFVERRVTRVQLEHEHGKGINISVRGSVTVRGVNEIRGGVAQWSVRKREACVEALNWILQWTEVEIRQSSNTIGSKYDGVGSNVPMYDRGCSRMHIRQP